MSVTSPASRLPALACVLLSSTLVLPACDKLGGDKTGAEPDAAPTKTDEGDDAKRKTEQDAKKAADEAAAKLKAEQDAKKAADDEDSKKKAELEAEAKRQADEDAKKPVLLTDIAITTAGGMFGGAGALKIDAKAKFNEAINSGTYVHVKATCKKDARIFADVAQVNLTDYSKQLHQFAVGETTALNGQVFAQGIDSAMTPCQFDFRLGAGFGGVSVPLAIACFDGATKLGPCDPPIAAAAMSGATLPLDVVDVVVKAEAAYGGTPGISINSVLQVNKPIEDNAQLVIKGACVSGTRKFVDTQTPYLGAGPFKYVPGESLARPVRMFWNPAFAFTEAPSLCDVSFMLRKLQTGSWSEYDQTMLERGCFKEGGYVEGACEAAAAAPPVAAALDATTAAVDAVVIELAAPYGAGPNQFNLKVQADVTAKAPIQEGFSLEANATCKVGSTARVEKPWLSGVELHFLETGETSRISGQAFTSEALAGSPKSCEVVFTAGNRVGGAAPAAPAAPVELGRWCLKKGKLNAGKC